MAAISFQNVQASIHERRLQFESNQWREREPITMKNYRTLFGLEENFDWLPTQKWMEDNWSLSIYVIALYLLFIIFGQSLMRKREPFHLRKLLTIWNFSLAVFSIIGTYYGIPEVFYVLNRKNGFYYSCCYPGFKHNNVGTFWAWLFVLSKVLELGDTVFIVLRKQPLQFLHYYHHVTVLFYTWYSYGEFIAPSRWYIAVNYLIHSFMYSYFTLRTMRIRIPKPIAIAVTSSQMIQMVVGVAANVQAYYAKQAGLDCDVSYNNIFLSFFMYASYLLLFAKFFFDAYINTSLKKQLYSHRQGRVEGKELKGE